MGNIYLETTVKTKNATNNHTCFISQTYDTMQGRIRREPAPRVLRLVQICWCWKANGTFPSTQHLYQSKPWLYILASWFYSMMTRHRKWVHKCFVRSTNIHNLASTCIIRMSAQHFHHYAQHLNLNYESPCLPEEWQSLGRQHPK